MGEGGGITYAYVYILQTEGSEDPAKLFNEWQALNKKKNDESKKKTKKKSKSSES